MRRRVMVLLLLAASGCAGEELLHGLDEPQANEVLVALDEGGISGRKLADDGGSGWTVAVPSGDATRAHRILSERELPRPRPPGFGDVFGKGSMVPTPTEEHALYLHALAGELARSVEAIDGVVGARVHLGLPQPDALRPGDRPPPRGAVLVRCRPASCAAVRALEPGIRSLVAGAADGLDASAVAVVVTEAGETPRATAPEAAGRRSPVLLALAAIAAAGALAVAGVGLRTRLRRSATA
jgi:type III secretion protein J